MYKFITFLEINPITNNAYIPCGSDSFWKVDQRLGLSRIIDLADNYISKQTINNFIGYQVRLGSINNSNVIYSSKSEYNKITWDTL
jgi:hypothetical protein